MAKFNAEYIDPKPTSTEVPDGARAAFQNKEAEQLFAGLGLRKGGFQANENHVFVLDATGKLVAPTPDDAQKDNGMTAAAQAGRLYIMDKNYHLRQVRLESKEDDGFTFVVTDPLSPKQRPTSRMDYYFMRLSASTSDFVKNMSQRWADLKRDLAQNWADFKKDMAQLRADMKEDWENIKKGEFSISKMLKRDWERMFGRRDKNVEQAKTKEDEPLQTQQTVSTPEAEENKEKTVEELLKTNPTKQTTPEFERYLSELGKRASGKPVEQALNKEDGKPADYYEGLAQELEGKIAGKILDAAPNKETDPVGREEFFHKQKPVMASISKNLRDFVQKNVDPKQVGDYYAARASKDESMKANLDTKKVTLQNAATRLVASGANEYTQGVQKQNEATQQTMQQSRPKQLQQNQLQAQQLQAPPPKAPTMGGRGGR